MKKLISGISRNLVTINVRLLTLGGRLKLAAYDLALSGLTTSKPAFAGQPLPGIMPQIVNDNGQEVTASDQVGNLCIYKAVAKYD